MKFAATGRGDVEVEGLTHAGVPAMRLLAYHSPDLKVNCSCVAGTLQVRLGDIDFRPSFAPPEPVNSDRAQLAALGRTEG